MSTIIDELEKEQFVSTHPKFGIGDTIRVSFKVVEGKKERIQHFEGVVVKFQNSGISRTFTTRKVVDGIGVEKSFPMHSPLITEIKSLREGKARRAKLIYLRDRLGSKAGRIKARDPRFK